MYLKSQIPTFPLTDVLEYLIAEGKGNKNIFLMQLIMLNPCIITIS